ncbi:formyltransferase family protein [Chitinophaga niabensis]|uniref:Methionyl-tRNA formyltransferase n=1 Tax=Chitinophaga niabensis TaxID=536979 RepID=A0A1N6JY12_9BACT|nr:formyltransferase family protein [Chitinophaga niabensis]SIO49119.1 methionyl-tRNA formyltransferase [Chitinophaga niabensis]
MKIVIANSNNIHKNMEQQLDSLLNPVFIHTKEELDPEWLKEMRPDYIFFLHWSDIIPAPVYTQFNCIVFHMTDLPYGRGGSPLQNLIVRGHDKTMLSAIKVEKGLDTGAVYLKKELSLLGTAEEIFIRASALMKEMIIKIVNDTLQPAAQTGEPVIFKRRKPEESNMATLTQLQEMFDHIRMLDAEGYPHAFIENEQFRFEFSRASLKKDSIIADVRIIKK